MKQILVIGDLILDVDHRGRYFGLSVTDGATPVGAAQSDTFMWGGAGLLARNILALGGGVSFISIIGKDEFAARANRFSHSHLKKIFFEVPSRSTTVKERFLMDRRKFLTWYRFNHTSLPRALQNKILKKFSLELRRADAVVVADYRHGLLSQFLAREIVRECVRARVPVYIDSQVGYKESNHHWCKGADLFCLNRREAESVDPSFDSKRMKLSLMRIQKILHTENIVVKLGERGSAALLGGAYIATKAYRVKAVDPTGAGDAFLGCLVLGNNPPDAYDFRRANMWAALSTTMIGTELPSVARFRKLAAKN